MFNGCQLISPNSTAIPYSEFPPPIYYIVEFPQAAAGPINPLKYSLLNYTMELINETVGRWRDWGYLYFIIDRELMLRHSAYIALPEDSYIYKARVENKIIWVAQVPIGSSTTQFLMTHGASVVKPLPSILQR